MLRRSLILCAGCSSGVNRSGSGLQPETGAHDKASCRIYLRAVSGELRYRRFPRHKWDSCSDGRPFDVTGNDAAGLPPWRSFQPVPLRRFVAACSPGRHGGGSGPTLHVVETEDRDKYYRASPTVILSSAKHRRVAESRRKGQLSGPSPLIHVSSGLGHCSILRTGYAPISCVDFAEVQAVCRQGV